MWCPLKTSTLAGTAESEKVSAHTLLLPEVLPAPNAVPATMNSVVKIQLPAGNMEYARKAGKSVQNDQHRRVGFRLSATPCQDRSPPRGVKPNPLWMGSWTKHDNIRLARNPPASKSSRLAKSLLQEPVRTIPCLPNPKRPTYYLTVRGQYTSILGEIAHRTCEGGCLDKEPGILGMARF